jgi:hypothetical protein
MGVGTPHSGRRSGRSSDIEDEEGGFIVRLRKRLLFPLAALLGAAVVVLPALAASSEAKLEVNENCNFPNWPCWTVPGSNPTPASVKIAPGGVVTFADKTSVAANIAWTGAAPTCSPAVPVSPAPASTGWEGTCTFEAPGRYRFESSSLYYAYTKYEIVVEAATTGTTPTGTGTAGGSSGASGSGTSTSGSGTQTQTGGGSAGQGGNGAAVGSPFVGNSSSACKLHSTQRGQSVHGSVEVSQAGAGGRLEVELLATRASLAGAGHSSHVQVGRLVRSSVPAGTDTFAVSLDARARHALHVHGHLALSVKIALTSVHGSPVTLTRSVVVRG